MMRSRRQLPPLTALVTFEAVARLGSFTRAAAELGVTQAAVSRQIHVLEEIFGFPLFERLHRRVELTRKGVALSVAATNAFDTIAETLADITGNDLADELVISASVAVSQLWLLPKIATFSRLHPHIRLRIVTQNGAGDPLGGEIDLALRYGDGMWADGQAEYLFDDEIFPVCSPNFAAEHMSGATGPAELVGFPLITSHAEGSSWTGWAEWLAAFQIQLPKRTAGIRCSFYTEEIHAALNGQGIALGWKRLVAGLIAENKLVRVTGDAIRTRNAYFVVVPSRRRKQALVDQFIAWLKSEASLPA